MVHLNRQAHEARIYICGIEPEDELLTEDQTMFLFCDAKANITTNIIIIFRLFVVIHPINYSNIVFMVVQRSCSALLTVIHLKAHQLSDVVS